MNGAANSSVPALMWSGQAGDRTDEQLLRLAQIGDQRAYEAIVARYREPLRRACARIVPDRAEDAVQHALLSAWIALERGVEVRELRPWLYSIARNAAIDQARGVRSELVELGPELPGGEDPAQTLARRREVEEVLNAVAALPDRQRQALVDTALHGRATEAVAVDLGLSGGALRQLVHRARTTVRASVPSVAFPVPGWLAELLSEEGARRGLAVLGSGSGAAVVTKATATVATVGAVVAGGVTAEHAAQQRAMSSRSVAAMQHAQPAPRSGTRTARAGAAATAANATSAVRATLLPAGNGSADAPARTQLERDDRTVAARRGDDASAAGDGIEPAAGERDRENKTGEGAPQSTAGANDGRGSGTAATAVNSAGTARAPASASSGSGATGGSQPADNRLSTGDSREGGGSGRTAGLRVASPQEIAVAPSSNADDPAISSAGGDTTDPGASDVRPAADEARDNDDGAPSQE
ncbi:MAG: sigma-70 family RNA polymerase sigma factor [Patulibacter sp.]